MALYSQPRHNVHTRNPFIYIALHKPIGYDISADGSTDIIRQLLTTSNCLGNPNKKTIPVVYPISNLDSDSEGLVLFTNDTHITSKPQSSYEMEYEISIDNALTRQARNILSSGMALDSGYADGLTIKKEFNKGKRTIITIITRGEPSPHLRQMFEQIGYHVISLRRIKIGKYKMNILPVGKWKYINKESFI